MTEEQKNKDYMIQVTEVDAEGVNWTQWPIVKASSPEHAKEIGKREYPEAEVTGGTPKDELYG